MLLYQDVNSLMSSPLKMGNLLFRASFLCVCSSTCASLILMRRSRSSVCSCWVVMAGVVTGIGGRGWFGTVGTGGGAGIGGELRSSKSVGGGAGVL